MHIKSLRGVIKRIEMQINILKGVGKRFPTKSIKGAEAI
jgi:hypothetical protein